MRAGYSYGDYRLGRRKHGYVVTWTEGDHRRCYRLGTKLESEAKPRLIAFATAHERSKAKGAVTVGPIVEAYIADRARDGKTTSKQRVSWKALAPIFSATPVEAIDKRLCHHFRDARIKAGRKVGTVCTDLAVLRAALHWAVKMKITPAAPFVWMPPQPAPKDVRLTSAEAERLLAACGAPHVRLFVVLGLATAGRAAALLGLTWDRVDFDRGVVHLEEPGRARTAKARPSLPMNGSLRAALQEARAGALSPYVIEWNAKRVA